jgi:hypothetical protein
LGGVILFYDDGYEEYVYVEKEESNIPKIRAYQLNNGDVISINDLLLEFEDNLFYEVKEPVGLVNPYFERTGRKFTIEQLNYGVR